MTNNLLLAKVHHQAKSLNRALLKADTKENARKRSNIGKKEVGTNKKELKQISLERYRSQGTRYRSFVATYEAKRRVLRRIAAAVAPVAQSRPKGRVGILMYHRVAESSANAAEPSWNVTPNILRYQLQGLRQQGWEPIPLCALLAANAGDETLPSRSFVVTFDDGYENFYTAARPILHELKIPATVFLATSYVNSPGPFPFDDWTEAGSSLVPQDSWRPMTLEQCRELRRDPLIEIGAHTHTHRNFCGDPRGLQQDLGVCLRFLQMQLAVKAAAFAFPFGLADPDLLEIARRAGVVCALTTEEELVNPRSEPFGWGRFLVAAYDTPSTLAACLGGWYSQLRQFDPRHPKNREWTLIP
jgi:peptidoglycan/xylan/chitin deacetylase (PgdA/CDA1 family)